MSHRLSSHLIRGERFVPHSRSVVATILTLSLLAMLVVPPGVPGAQVRPAGATPIIATGTVTDAWGGPIANAWVHAQYYDGTYWQWVASAQTDENGDYAIYDTNGHGADDNLRFDVIGVEGYLRPPHLYGNWNGETPLSDIDFALQPAPVIARGTVTDSVTGHGAGDAWVAVIWFDGGHWQGGGFADTDESGDYTLYDYYGLGAGSYRFYAGGWGYHQSGAIDRTWSGATPLALDFTLYPEDVTVIASGSVTDASSGEPIEGAEVSAYWSGVDPDDFEHAGSVYTDANGHYVFTDASCGEGTYEFGAVMDGYVIEYRSGYWDGVTPLSIDFVLEHANVIATGTVTDAVTGEGIEHARVNGSRFDTASEYPSLAGSAVTDDQGAYVLYDLYDLGSGDYEFGAWAYPAHLDSVKHYAQWDGVTPLVVDFALEPLLQDPDPKPLPLIIRGNDRYLTAIAGSKAAFDSADVVVIATGESFADALGGAGLAGAVDGPLLLTQKASLPGPVMTEVGRLKAKKAYILGGPGAVSGAVESSLKAKLGDKNVIRLQGANRYQTADRVAAETIRVLNASGGYSGDAFVATGANFPDALGASPIAAAQGMPVFLADPTRSTVQLPSSVRRVWVTGGTAVVAPQVETSLRAGGRSVTRLAGANRFETAAKVAAFGVSRGMAWEGVGITTGMNFPDALAAGPVLGSRGAVMLLTDASAVPQHTSSALTSNKTKISRVTFFGGDAAVPPGVRRTVNELIK